MTEYYHQDKQQYEAPAVRGIEVVEHTDQDAPLVLLEMKIKRELEQLKK